MYDEVLREMRDSVKAGRVRFTSHALDEMAVEGYAKADAYCCILTGEIIEDQLDPRYKQIKYIVVGEAENEDEIGLIARFDNAAGIVIITIFQLQVDDYD